MNKEIEDLLQTLPRPDDIGQSEYRLVHELVEDLAVNGDCDPEDQMKQVIGSMEELIGWARDVQNRAQNRLEGMAPFKPPAPQTWPTFPDPRKQE